MFILQFLLKYIFKLVLHLPQFTRLANEDKNSILERLFWSKERSRSSLPPRHVSFTNHSYQIHLCSQCLTPVTVQCYLNKWYGKKLTNNYLHINGKTSNTVKSKVTEILLNYYKTASYMQNLFRSSSQHLIISWT